MAKLDMITKRLETMAIKASVIDSQEVWELLNALKLEILALEHVYSRAEIIQRLASLRALVCESPFIARAQVWPRGYQGDFETIKHIIDGKNKAVKHSLGYLLEDFFIHSDICKQHVNKIRVQSELVGETIRSNRHPRIMSIGCGTSEDLAMHIDLLKRKPASITLVDIDRDALACSSGRLAAISDQLTCLNGNIYRIARQLQQQYDLILIGGVFDYLNDKTISSILRSLRANIAGNGKIFFTNIADGNPYRVFMEYLSNWQLIERSQEDIIELIKGAGWPANNFHIQKDKTGLTYLVELNQVH
ncbi:class I SAM-dependent methyltransferase [Spirosoma gilvum]